MKYITISDLSETIRKNIWKIPRDIDFIIGIPRSGMICASMISCYLNVPLIDINGFINGLTPTGGSRLQFYDKKRSNKILVIDDTINSGISMNKIKDQLKNYTDYEFIYCVIYLEGNSEHIIDLYFEDIRNYKALNFCDCVIYEWNIFHHYPPLMQRCLYDIDGVFCVEPPDERNEKEYLKYIKNAKPLFIPSSPIGGIITYRLIKNKEITEKWLHNVGIKYNELIMFNANSWEERHNSGITSEIYKGMFYKSSNVYQLFIESSNYQAKRIAEISNKPVYCVDTNKMYN